MSQFPLDPQSLALEIDLPVESWPGNCHQVATLVLEKAPIRGMRLARGHYHGFVSRRSVYHSGPCQHSWLVLEDGRILDPTRWAMERPDAPEIYVGLNDAYDEAGLEISSRIPPVFPGTGYGYEGVLAAAAPDALAELALSLGATPPGDVDGKDRAIQRLAERIHYALREDPAHLQDARRVYAALAAVKLKALIKIDLWHLVMEPERLQVRPGANRLFDAPPREDASDLAKLFQILARFLSVEERELSIEDELEELGFKLEDLHEALNDLERDLKWRPDLTIEKASRSPMHTLAVIAGDLLGKGFGVSLRVERFAASLGLTLQDLDSLLKRMGARVGYDLRWL